MREFAEKLRVLEREMASEKGAFQFFALFLREDAPGLWDLVVSAPWMDPDKGEALRYVVRKVQAVATTDELEKLSRVVIVEVNQPGISAIQSAMHIEHGLSEIQDSNFFGLQIDHAFVITASRGAAA